MSIIYNDLVFIFLKLFKFQCFRQIKIIMTVNSELKMFMVFNAAHIESIFCIQFKFTNFYLKTQTSQTWQHKCFKMNMPVIWSNVYRTRATEPE